LTVKRLLDRLIDALTSARRQDRSVLAALTGYLVVWTLFGVIEKSNQDLHPDMTELIAWSRDLALGFPKHPPFAAVVVRGWFAWFPITDAAYYLLAILMATTALGIAWQLYADYLSPLKRVLALCLLTFIPFFNFHALKFNVNTVLIPLWAVTTFWFLRSFRRRSAGYAALAGIGAALCMVTKYWSIFLLVGLAVAALSDSRRGAYFKSGAPWITILTGLVIVSPHIGWLEKHDFSPIGYAMLVHGNHTFVDALWAALRYCLDSMAYVIVPIAAVLLIARPNWQTVADTFWPADRERRLVAVAFGVTLWSPVLAGLVWGVEINAIWTMSSWILFPVLVLSSPRLRVDRPSVRVVAGCAVLLPIVMLAAAPAAALVHFKLGLPPEITHTKMLAKKVETAWRTVTAKPLAYVGGDGDLAYGVATYSQDRPQALPGLPEKLPAQLKKNGAVFVCTADDVPCIRRSRRIASGNPASRTIEVELAGTYWGLADKVERNVIILSPPAPDQPPP
jgi:hypothetical protein